MLARRRAGSRATDWTQCGATRCKERSGVAGRHGGGYGDGLAWASAGLRRRAVDARREAVRRRELASASCFAVRRRAPSCAGRREAGHATGTWARRHRLGVLVPAAGQERGSGRGAG